MKKCLFVLVFLSAVVSLPAQESKKLSLDTGMDLVSSYVWRGMYQTGASIQPSVGLSACGFQLGAWGSTDFSTTAKELDFTLSYEFSGFSVGVTDYWWNGEGVSFFKERSGHYWEGQIGYTFGEAFPLALSVNAMISGGGDKKADGGRYHSTYVAAGYPFQVGGTDCEVGVGVSPWEGMYSEKFDVCSLSVKVSKGLSLSAGRSLPVFAELIFSPSNDNAFLVFGFSF